MSRTILLGAILATLLINACSYNNKEAVGIKARVLELSTKHPVTDTIARIHYVAGDIAIPGEESKIDLEIEPVSEIKTASIAFFASEGLKIQRKNIRHYKKFQGNMVLLDSIRYTPKKAGDHTLSIYILLDTSKYGTVARVVTVPVRAGI